MSLKKIFLAIFLFLLPYIQTVIYETYPFPENIYRCNKDLETDFCGIYSRNDETLYIRKKCGDNEQCLPVNDMSDDYYQCVKKIKLSKNGKKCSHNAECMSEKCDNGKCITIPQNGECLYHPQCGKGSYCDENTGRCEKFLGGGGTCENSDQCGPGLLCNMGACVKFGSVNVGEEAEDPRLCKTGLSFEGVCISVKEDYFECDYFGKCSPLVEGVGGGIGESMTQQTIHATCRDVNTIAVCPYTTIKQKLFRNYLDRFEDLKIDKITSKDDFVLSEGSNSVGFKDKKTSYAYFLYNNYDLLYSLDAFKDNGKINDDKKCVIDFLFQENRGSFIDKPHLIIIMILLLMF